MKIKSIKPVGKRDVYDISVADVEHYILDNGIASHNTGSYYSADNIFILGRQQEKEGTEIVGYNFIINVEKSRYVKEKSKIPVSVSYEGGISRWSGLLDIALESGHVVKPSNGWYSRMDANGEIEDKKFRVKDTDTADFWMPILKQKTFTEFVKGKYQVAAGEIMKSDQYEIELEDVDDGE
jgi:hypothetical protein